MSDLAKHYHESKQIEMGIKYHEQAISRLKRDQALLEDLISRLEAQEFSDDAA